MLLFQYLANVDEAPASLGGKENYWRKLTLDSMLSSLKVHEQYLRMIKWKNSNQKVKFTINHNHIPWTFFFGGGVILESLAMSVYLNFAPHQKTFMIKL